jgi:RNA polymerase sigma-70 factor (ECF subfamily)
LFKIAYRMLGSRADAEDVVQDVYLRLHERDLADTNSPIAFLITTTTRLCLDRLRSRTREPALCSDGWGPAAADEDHFAPPDTQLELRERISTAFLSVVECLGAAERTAFLLHDVFDYDYGEVAQVLGKSLTSCRQIVHRARERLRARRPQFSIASETRERLLKMFFAAVKTGDRRAVMTLLAQRTEHGSAGEGERHCVGMEEVPGFA